MRIFYSFSSIDWTRVLLVMTALTTTWVALIEIIPERYHHRGTVILGALTAGVAVLIRGGRPSVAEAVKDSLVEKIEGK